MGPGWGVDCGGDSAAAPSASTATQQTNTCLHRRTRAQKGNKSLSERRIERKERDSERAGAQ